MRYVRAMEPPILILEAVPGLIESASGANIAFVVSMLEECGYACAFRIVAADKMGSPQRRRRAYIVAVHLEQAGLEDNEGQPYVEGLMQRAELLSDAQGEKCFPAQDFMLPDTHPYVRTELKRQEARVSTAQEMTADATALLLDECRKRGIRREDVKLPPAWAESPWVKQLTPRETMGVAFWPMAEPSTTMVDVYPLLPHMGRGRGNVVPTLLPGTKLMILNRPLALPVRPLLGLECMRMMGFSAEILLKYASECIPRNGMVPDCLFSDMASKSFAGNFVLTLTVAILIGLTVKHLESGTFRASSPASRSTPSNDSETQALIDMMLEDLGY